MSTPNTGRPHIQHAYCQCPIGLAQACSHIGALLFAFSHAKPSKSSSESCTSQPCKWIIPGRQVKPTGPISSLPNKCKGQLKESEDFTENLDPLAAYDPRHSDDGHLDLHRTLQHLQDLKNVFPQTGMSHLWNIPDHAPEAVQEMEVQDVEDVMFARMKSLIFSEGNEPQLSITQDFIYEFIESYTRDQRTSDMWQKLHIGRLTSSLFGDVLKTGSNPNSLIKQILEGFSLHKYAVLLPAV